jgi:hypothetical protein
MKKEQIRICGPDKCTERYSTVDLTVRRNLFGKRYRYCVLSPQSAADTINKNNTADGTRTRNLILATRM